MSEEDSLLLATHNPHTVIDPSTGMAYLNLIFFI